MTRASSIACARAALASALISCGAGAPAPPAPPAPASARAEAPPLLRPARYLALDRAWIELTPEGLERVVLNGRRAELRGAEIVSLGPPEPEVDGGARVPGWASPGAARYVFWKGKQLFAADGWGGALSPLATLPADPHHAFPWLDGAGVSLPGGVVIAKGSGGPPRGLGVAAPVSAIAADARRGVVTTALGHAWLTLDGGASFRDVSVDLGDATSFEVRGDAIVAVLRDGRERSVTAAGVIVDGDRAPGSARDKPPAGEPDAFRDATGMRPREAAARAGLPLQDGGVVIASAGFVGRFNPATLRVTSLAPLDPGLRDADCVPVRAGEAILLACVGPERAAVVDLTGAPRTERTFDLTGASELNRFVAADGDALGYLGPCDGSPPRVADVELGPNGEPYNASRQRTPVFCARAGRDTWVEHRLDADDQRDVVAWIPRPGGDAVALLARQASFLDDRDRVSARGGLRVVRVARSEPPLAITPWSFERTEPVSRALRARADDTIVGWLPSNGYGSSLVSVTIDAAGHVSARGGPPHATQLVTAGRFALSRSDDGRLWETVDAGGRWAEVDPPPGARQGWGGQPSSCSPAGCLFGSFVRLGWSARDDAPERPSYTPSERPARDPARYRRPQPPPALIRLSCAPAGPPVGRRVADSGGFGYTPQPQPRGGSPARIGALGYANLPWGSGHTPASGDGEFGWLAPLDVTATLRRVTVPLARLGVSSTHQRSADLRVGYLLTPEGGLEAFATGWRDQCVASVLEAAGITRPIGGCADDPSVGVDLGGRLIVVHPTHDGIVIASADAPPITARAKGGRVRALAGASIPVAIHDVHRTAAAGPLRGFVFGVGARAGAPVVVALDAIGEASLSPVDPERGTLGPEERLRPLTEASLGSDPACSPRAGEATVVLSFEGLIGVDRARLRGVAPSGGAGVAVIRWSRERACVDAVEIPVRDDRFDEQPGPYEPHGSLRKLIARFGARDRGATLALLGSGSELRQRLACTGVLKGAGDAP